MCYTAPGPRCSTYAREKRKVAIQNYFEAKTAYDVAKGEYEQSNDLFTHAKLEKSLAELKVAEQNVDVAETEYKKAAEAKSKAHKELKEATNSWYLTKDGIQELKDRGLTEKADEAQGIRDTKIRKSKEVDAVNKRKKDAAKANQTPVRATTPPPAPVTQLDDYVRDFHRAPTAEEGNAPIHDMSDLYGDDYLEHPEHYTASSGDRELMTQLRRAAGNPDATLTIYRALPKEHSHINDGDWVALSNEYAQQHLTAIAASPNAGEWHIIESKVPASTLWSEGNDLAEWGYNGERITT